jgi:hypothetical protein
LKVKTATLPNNKGPKLSSPKNKKEGEKKKKGFSRPMPKYAKLFPFLQQEEAVVVVVVVFRASM